MFCNFPGGGGGSGPLAPPLSIRTCLCLQNPHLTPILMYPVGALDAYVFV